MNEFRDNPSTDVAKVDEDKAVNPSSGPEQRKCSHCGTWFAVLDRKRLPFCSARCQEVDLGKWLSESIGLPWEDPHGSGEGNFLEGLEA